jgi:hypothetical protein
MITGRRSSAQNMGRKLSLNSSSNQEKGDRLKYSVTLRSQ